MIAQVTDALVDAITRATPDLGDWVLQHSLSAAEADPAANHLVVALLAAAPHPHLVNRPLVASPEGWVRPPLALHLSYLMTYIGPHDEAQVRLDLVASVFHTTPVLEAPQLPPTLAAEVGSVTVHLVDASPDERNQVWGALGRPGRLGLFYEVDVAPVDLLFREGAGTVVEHRLEYVERR